MTETKPKTQIFNLRLTEEERQALRVNAALAGVSAGEYVRRLCCVEPEKAEKKAGKR
tara:strand:+ start:891 stop:1061 length:171 start_codon:yes stop_codon:yes gene_type:complete